MLTEEGIVHVPGISSHWVRLSNGAKAHFLSSGETGPAVILCHGGLPGSSGTAGWRFMMPFLGSNGFRVYAPDFPGYGWADTREEYWPRLGVNDHVDFIHMFANAMCLDRFHLSGNSMGCNNTVQYTLQHPERVISFILIAGGVGDIVDPSKRIAGSLDVRALNQEAYDGTPASMRKIMEAVVYDPTKVSDDLCEMRSLAANRQTESLKAYQAYPTTFGREPKFSQRNTTINRIDRIDIPGIYLYGKDDVLIPVENGYAQEGVTPNIQYFYPEACGHQGQTDQPDMFNQVFLEFFRDGKVSRKTADWAGVSKRRPELPQYVEQAVMA